MGDEMSNIPGGDSEKSLILYFFLFTAIFYVGAYLSLDYFGYTFADVPENGNVITPLVSAGLNQIIGLLGWFYNIFYSEPSDWIQFIFSFIPIIDDLYSGIVTILTAILNAMIGLITQINGFINVWNILNIYIFYIIFIPYATITIIIIFELIIRLFEGLIP